MDTELFLQMLQIDSTSGKEGELSAFLAERLLTPKCRVERFPVESMTGDCPDGHPLPENLLFSWGTPKVLFCTHLDTVPPYMSPSLHPISLEADRGCNGTTAINGRGTCDAKGQIFAMYSACLELERQGCTGFGLLLLAGEETGSHGAKAFNKVSSATGARSYKPDEIWLIVGEPTDNCMASAAKGTKSFEVEFTGEAFHSGYPEHGRSAVMMFNDFVNALRSIRFPYDEILGETTWNIGRLSSGNPQNILSDRLTCRIYFRTTFETDEMVCNVMKNIAGVKARLRFGRPRVQDGSDIVAKEVADWQKYMKVTAYGGDDPTRFEVLEGFPSKPVAFGSDAPQLKAFGHKILCGPGSILVAHRDDEHITLHDIETAVQNYINIYKKLGMIKL